MKQPTPLKILETWIKENPDGDVLEKIEELKSVERQCVENAFMEGVAIMEGPYEGKKHYFTSNFEQ